MNQEEEVPTRVTRGALRRRSIDQDATPQNPQGTGTTVAGGTPKKGASAAKKAPTLGAIQEGEGRPSTPVGGGRVSRRRISETIDTPTAAPNKLVQSLKDAESVVGSGSGRRSRNASLALTEENVQELNSTNEGTGTTGRTRTPARLRGSLETLSSTTPQTAPTGVRRSTRRNSVTSDDGSVQSLPITTPRTPIGRSLKEEPIVEEDITSGDRAGSDTSVRNTPTRSVSQSPRGGARSPLLPVIKQEITPPRGSVSPQLNSSARKTPSSTPRSKNVSFTDDSKQEDHQSGYPKTPTSPGKKFVLVEVNDLRNTPLITGTPKANAVIALNGSEEKAAVAQNEQGKAKESPAADVGEAAGKDAPEPSTEVEGNEKKDTETIAPSPAPEKVADTPAPLNVSSSIATADRSLGAAPNDVSGIEALESSIVEEDAVNTSNSMANGSNSLPTEGEQFSKYWSHSVRGTTTKGIDAFSVRKQEEKKAEEEQTNLVAAQKMSSQTPEKKKPETASVASDDEKEDEEEEEEESGHDEAEDKRHELVDDEAMEVDGYQSGDSLDAEIRQEMAANELVDQGEDLGSEDTDEDSKGDEEEENDSFIVTDDDGEVLDEDALLEGTGDDLSTASSPAKTPELKTAAGRRRIVHVVDDSDEEEEKKKEAKRQSTTSSSSERSLTERKRSVKQLTTTDEEASPEKKPNRSVMTEEEEEQDQKKDESANQQQPGTPEKLDSTSEAAKEEHLSPAKSGKPSETETPRKAADVSVKPVPKSPAQSRVVQDSDTSAEVFAAASQTDVSAESATTKENDEDESQSAEKSGSFGVAARRSLPAVASDKESGKGVARKSLPAGTKMQFVEEATTDELHPSSSNREASYQEEESEMNEEKRDQQNDREGDENDSAPVQVTTDEDEFYEASDIVEEGLPEEEEQKHAGGMRDAAMDNEATAIAAEEPVVAPAKPARKSMPTVPLISAQFYLGGSKKEKRNTLAGGEQATMGVTSTPNQKPTGKKDKKNAAPSNLVANPFALASAKANRARLSLESAAAGLADDPDSSVQKVKKPRHSLPLMKLNGVGADSKSKDVSSVEEEEAETEVSPRQQQQQHLDDPEPMEVDEYEEEGHQPAENGGEAGGHEQPAQNGTVEVKPKTPKKKPKALSEFDLESILTRCNEVVRADKERKKQMATLAQQKRDQKRRLRELREQQEKLESADGNGEAGGTDDDVKPNTTTSANEESAEQQSTGGDAAKKKKKRKKKVKNYLLEEISELKKDRVSEALLRKMDAIEARKQRKKERRAEKLKLLNKENGGTRGDGIGAKLEKVAKKKQKQEKESEAAKEELTQQQPAVRAAISAFAVFQQLQNGHTDLDGPLGGVGAEKKHTKAADVDAPAVPKSVDEVAPTGEQAKTTAAEKLDKKKPKKLPSEAAQETVVVAAKKTEKLPDEPVQKPAKKNPVLLGAKTPSADDVIAPKKKKKVEAMPAAAESATVQKAASESQLVGQLENDVPAEKLKRKQKQKAEISAAAPVEVVAVPETDPLSQEETHKVKKQKKSKMEEKVQDIAEPKSAKEKKKRVPASEFFNVPEAAEVEPVPQEETGKPKKPKKNKDKMEASVDKGSKEGAGKQEVLEKKRVPAAEFFTVSEPVHQEETGKPKKEKKNKAAKMVVPAEEERMAAATAAVQDFAEHKESKKVLKKEAALARAVAPVEDGLAKKKKLGTANKPMEEESTVTSALREVRDALEGTKKNKKATVKKGKEKEDDAAAFVAADPAKKRKRDPLDGSATSSSTPRPTKLRALQRADLGFVEETVTPDKTRLKRNAGFEEMQATPKAVGFKVSSLLPTDDFANVGKTKKLKRKGTLPEPNRALPLPVWTRSGYFIEAPDENGEHPTEKPPTAAAATSNYIPLKGHSGFKLKTLQDMPNGGGGPSSSSSASVAKKPHRIDPDTVPLKVVNLKRQQLLERTAHLREKKRGGSGWM